MERRKTSLVATLLAWSFAPLAEAATPADGPVPSTVHRLTPPSRISISVRVPGSTWPFRLHSETPGEDELRDRLLRRLVGARHAAAESPRARGSFRHELTSALDNSSAEVTTNATIRDARHGRWKLEYSSSLSYAGGSVIDEADSRDGAIQVAHLTVERRFSEGSWLRAGRFTSSEISLVGSVDGAQVELDWGRALRVGTVAGLRTSPGTIEPGTSVAAAYAATELGQEGRLFHRSTVGLFGALYEGAPDRLAVVVSQRTDVTSRLRIHSSSEIDLGTFDGDERRVGLTAMHVETVSPLTSRATVRVGADHRKHPDTPSVRDALPTESERAFTRGNARYWVGGAYRFPGNVVVDGEWSVLDAHDREELESLWRIGARKSGLPLLERASIGATLRNLDGYERLGYGGEIDAHFPLTPWGITLSPRIALHIANPESHRDVALTEVGVRAAITRSTGTGTEFALDLGVNHSFVDHGERVVFELGARLVW